MNQSQVTEVQAAQAHEVCVVVELVRGVAAPQMPIFGERPVRGSASLCVILWCKENDVASVCTCGTLARVITGVSVRASPPETHKYTLCSTWYDGVKPT